MMMMNVGMLWLDDDKRATLDEKVRRAADYYRDKYGVWPELCLVNGAALANEKLVSKILVSPSSYVLRDHFWVGMKTS